MSEYEINPFTGSLDANGGYGGDVTSTSVTTLSNKTISSASNTLSIDHGILTGLSDNDHPQYLLTSAGMSVAKASALATVL